MFSGGDYEEVARWLRNFVIAHAKRENLRVEAVVDTEGPREGQSYGLRLRLGEALRPAPPEPPVELGPRDAKRSLARSIVARFHGAAASQEAEAEFDRVFRDRRPPEEMPEVSWPANGSEVHLPALLAGAFGVSTSEARRNLASGGVRIDGEPVPDDRLDISAPALDGRVLQLGKRRFARIRIEPAG